MVTMRSRKITCTWSFIMLSYSRILDTGKPMKYFTLYQHRLEEIVTICSMSRQKFVQKIIKTFFQILSLEESVSHMTSPYNKPIHAQWPSFAIILKIKCFASVRVFSMAVHCRPSYLLLLRVLVNIAVMMHGSFKNNSGIKC